MNIRCMLCIISLIICLLMSGCSGRSMVVLMPGPEGKVGTVSVSTDAGRVDITEAHQGAVVSGRGNMPSPPEAMPEEKITEIFSGALQSLPDPPKYFNVYFKLDSQELTDESGRVLSGILDAVERENPEVIRVVGHTDTSGEEEYNLKLSRKRAEAVTAMLVREGIDRDKIQTAFHGEYDLLVETADDVVELRNRRVEVFIQ